MPTEKQRNEAIPILTLQRIVEGTLPISQQHRHAHQRKIERNHYREQKARTPAFLAPPKGGDQRPGFGNEGDNPAHGAAPNPRAALLPALQAKP